MYKGEVMAASNDSGKKVTLHTQNVLNINGRDVYVDKDGTIARTEKTPGKKKKFAMANDKLRAQMAKQDISLAQIMAAQKQND